MDINKLMEQAMDLCNQSKFKEAKTIFEDVLKEDPQNSEAWRMLAQIHLVHENNPDKAENELIEALNINPQNMWALILMGNLLSRNRDDFESARKYYDRVLKEYPDNVIALNNVGATFMQGGKFEEAIPIIQKTLDIDNTYLNSWYALALCYYKTDKLEDAFDTCLKVLL